MRVTPQISYDIESDRIVIYKGDTMLDEIDFDSLAELYIEELKCLGRLNQKPE